MSNITKDRLGEIVEWLEQHSMNTLMRDNAALLRELQLLRASAPVLSEEQREALEAGAKALDDDADYYDSISMHKKGVVSLVAQAALLRAMAERGK